MSKNRFFAAFHKQNETAKPVTSTVLMTESDIHKISSKSYRDNIQVLQFTPICLLICIYETPLSAKRKSSTVHEVGFSMTQDKNSCHLDLEIPVLDLGVKLTRQYVAETYDGNTKYVRRDLIEILIQDTPIDEYLKLRGTISQLLTHHFIKNYKNIQKSEVEITDKKHIERIVLNAEIAAARIKI